MSHSAVTINSPRQLSCLKSCIYPGSAKAHHDRLLAVEHDLDALIELFDLAVTWGELDYSRHRLIEPTRWSGFVSSHRWHSAERAEQVFRLATDVALRSGRTNVVVALR